MASSKRTSTSNTTASTTNRRGTSTSTNDRGGPSRRLHSTSNPFYTSYGYDTTASRPRTGRRTTAGGRPGTAATTRPRTGYSTLGAEAQEIVCAVSESRGISPTVGLAFVNLDTCEAVLSQISDSQTYVRTVHKLMVFSPSQILIVRTAAEPESKLFSIIKESLKELNSNITTLHRKYWAETTGLEYIQQLAFAEDAEAIKTAVSGNYYAVCCFAAALKYVELGLQKTFPFHTLRIKYEASEGSMMVDLSTIHSLELVQNLQNPKSRDSLFGLLNETLTPMGGRLLRSNILQPSTNSDTLNTRYDALEELTTKEEMFFNTRQALKGFLDADRMLTALIVIPVHPDVQHTIQSANNVIMLKQFVNSIKPVFEALTGARCSMLQEIQRLCASENFEPIQQLINDVINEDVTYASRPLDLRNQRTYAVKSGVNGLLDVARQTYKEAMADAMQHVAELADLHNLDLQPKFDNVRQFYIRLPASDLESKDLPPVFLNVYRNKNHMECQTMDLMKLNQKIADSHTEVLLMSDKAVQELIAAVREQMSVLFKVSEGIALLDMMSSFGQLVTSQEYVRPQLTETLAIRAGRHPIREKIQSAKFIPNDVYATQQTRFQIITGCNMSGKSTYIRSIALMAVMVQIGCFAPAQYAAFPITRQLFARVSMDDSIEANVSTFAAEMRETAFILRNVDRQSIVIIDELGRGTSTRDGLAIALAIAEALVESRALVWFATHFRELATIMSERNGVVNLHLAVDTSEQDTMQMLYRISGGAVEEQHYGLALAKVLPLPPDVLEHAEHVSKTLKAQMERNKKTSVALLQNKRRTLILSLKEQLVQAKNSSLPDAELKIWLRDLQKEFVIRMTGIDDQVRKAEIEEQAEADGEEMERDALTTRGMDAASLHSVEDGQGPPPTAGSDVSGQLHRELHQQIYRDVESIGNVDATELGIQSEFRLSVKRSVRGPSVELGDD